MMLKDLLDRYRKEILEICGFRIDAVPEIQIRSVNRRL